jgi:dTDP-4-amino-4,6-dideoxygalactose transaminase
MSPYISGRPSFHIKSIFTRPKKQYSIFPLNQNRAFFFFSARYALVAAIEALGLQPGDKILLPSYNCGVEIDPLSHFGIEPVFYKINKDLLVDFDDLLNKISSRVKAILITHYLGFPQPVDQIQEICVDRNLLLIEDCAHALLSSYKGRPLGSYGDAAFFSLLKTLPVPNGGVLVLNREDLSFSAQQRVPSMLSTFLYVAELLNLRTWDDGPTVEQTVSRILHKGVYLSTKCAKLVVALFRKILNPKALYLVRPDSYAFNEELFKWGISNLSISITKNTDFERIKAVRRRNFQYLLNHFLENERGILPFRQLPPGVCPLFFPIIVKSAEYREKLYRTLKSRGVITHPWWDRFSPEVPWEAFPSAVYLKQKLFGLPIHQDLELQHLDWLIDEFEKAYQI